MTPKEKILKHNDQLFLDDLKIVKDVMVLPKHSNAYLHVKKNELLKEAETGKIRYYLTDSLFVVKRMAMVII